MRANVLARPRSAMPASPDRYFQAWPSPASDVQIWIAHLDAISKDELANLTAALDAAERAKAAQFRFERDRKHYLAARGLLRSTVGAAVGRPASELIFEYGAQGKPAIAENDSAGRPLHFSLSHAAGWAIFALSRERQVGIDLEASATFTQDDHDLAGLAARVLSVRELKIWKAIPDSATRSAVFLRAWIRKEACLKAMGKGLHIEPKEIEVLVDAAISSTLPITHVFSAAKEASRHWTLRDLAVPDGLVAALAVEAPSS